MDCSLKYFLSRKCRIALIFAKKPLDKDKIYKVIETVGLKRRELIPAYMLSGGDKQRIAIARALINDPQI